MLYQPPIWYYDYLIPSETDSAGRIERVIIDQLEQHGWGQHDVFSVRLAVEEALVNALKHGNHYDRDKHVRVECRLWADRVRICVCDEGDGFDLAVIPNPTDPDRIEAPSGRGILLMRCFMSRVRYNQKGNQVVLEKDRTDSEMAMAESGAPEAAVTA